MIERPRSQVAAPCPLCGEQPLFTQADPAQIGKYNAADLARMICPCGFEGEYSNIDDYEACMAAWNKSVAWKNRARREGSNLTVEVRGLFPKLEKQGGSDE